MSKPKDLTGEKIGDFLILGEGKGRRYGNSSYLTKTWLATCDCGLTFDKRGYDYAKAKGCPCKVSSKMAKVCRENFSKNVDETMKNKRVLVESSLESPCWELELSKHRTGYQYIYHNGGSELAHIYSYRSNKGDVPAGMEVSHLCHNRACHNPDHLIVESHSDNMKRSGEVGNLSHGRKYSDEQAIEAIRMIEAGLPLTYISGELGIAYHSLVDIKRGRSCKNLRNLKEKI